MNIKPRKVTRFVGSIPENVLKHVKLLLRPFRKRKKVILLRSQSYDLKNLEYFSQIGDIFQIPWNFSAKLTVFDKKKYRRTTNLESYKVSCKCPRKRFEVRKTLLGSFRKRENKLLWCGSYWSELKSLEYFSQIYTELFQQTVAN